jgi:uncharacterized lipoprotein YbaY
MPTLRGTVVLTPSLGRFHDATLHIRVLDVSEADAPAQQLAEVTVSPVTYDAATEETVPFTLSAPAWNPRNTITITAHLDQSGSGEVDAGDALTTQSHPPTTQPLLLHLTPVSPASP